MQSSPEQRRAIKDISFHHYMHGAVKVPWCFCTLSFKSSVKTCASIFDKEDRSYDLRCWPQKSFIDYLVRLFIRASVCCGHLFPPSSRHQMDPHSKVSQHFAFFCSSCPCTAAQFNFNMYHPVVKVYIILQ